MFINELDVGTEMMVEVFDNQVSVDFITTVCEVENEEDKVYIAAIAEKIKHAPMVVVDRIMYDEKTVNFNGAGSSCRVSASFEDKPYLWQNVTIPKITLPSGEIKHLIVSVENIEPYNRRSEYRQFLGIEGYLRIEDSRAVHNTLVRDISNSGVGFILTDDINININRGDLVNVSWYDGKYSPTRKEVVDTLYKVDAHVVRIIPMTKNKRLVGCILENPSQVIEKYVAEKQRERLQANRGRLPHERGG